MRGWIVAGVLAVLACGVAGSARAQDGAALTAALQQRYPSHEILPISCQPDGDRLAQAAGRLCAIDVATGLPRAVRRVALIDDGMVLAHVLGNNVFFGIEDYGGARTRFNGRVWQWDLARDAYLGLARLDDEGGIGLLAIASGVAFTSRGGTRLATGSGTRAVSVPEELWSAPTVTVGDTTYVLAENGVQVIEVAGTQVRTRPHAALPGTLVYRGDGAVVTRTVARRGRQVLHVLRLPGTTPIDVELPERTRSSWSTSRVDDHTIRLTTRPVLRLDLATGTLAPEAEAPAAFEPLLASSLRSARATEGGLYLQSSGGALTIDAQGVTPARRAPRWSRARCDCEGTSLHCGETTIAGACAEVQELEQIRSEYDEDPMQRAVQYTADGRFRVDRLEADLVRVTRLRDGARLWVRMFGPALFAQTDDGGYFTTDRALTARMAIRHGRGVLEGRVAPLAAEADALYRERLIPEFFAP